MLPGNALKILKAFREASQWQGSGEAVLRRGDDTGRVFFASGKIAWATASTIKKTFTTYMAEEAKLDENELKEVFAECKRNGRNFGETIVEWGMLDEPSLRKCLLHQIAESILEVFLWPDVASMFMPEHRPYKGNLTFDVAEVLQRVIEIDSDKRLPFHDTPVEELLKLAAQVSAAPEPGPAPRKRPSRSQPALYIAAAAVLLLGAVGAAFVLRARSTSTDANRLKRDASVAIAAIDAGAIAPAATSDAGLALVRADAGAEKPPAKDAGAPAVEAVYRPPPDGIVALAEGDGEGRIRVTSEPSKASIYVDGLAMARTTPFVLGHVASGREHVVMMEKDGFAPAFTRLTLKKNQTADVKLTLKRRGKPWTSRVVVHVESEPSGASVLLDGEPFKQLTPVDIALPSSKASKLVLIREGFEAWVHPVRPVPEVKVTIFAKLKKK